MALRDSWTRFLLNGGRKKKHPRATPSMPPVKQLDEDVLTTLEGFPNLRVLHLDYAHVCHGEYQLVNLIHKLPKLQELILDASNILWLHYGAFHRLTDAVEGWAQVTAMSLNHQEEPAPALKKLVINNLYMPGLAAQSTL
ncbi:hypothetical protein QBC35DRAFT_453896 [Podospora australis]|uniref:Uncharacterized protein n=1 Tax=Podospora australis TaxID=1536484 RepID=A0AAN7AEP6_9PEZI|nr:hypothetical protein QBC35DRAFT_453896 [Podospora australis]